MQPAIYSFNKRALGIFLLFIQACILTGCSSSPQVVVVDRQGEQIIQPVRTPLAIEWPTRQKQELAPGFEMKLVCPDDASISGNYTIDMDGSVKLPFNIRLEAAGKTLDAFTLAVNRAYAAFLTRPQITASIVKRQYYVDVQGLVIKPGQYILPATSRLDAAIGAAGGLEKGPTGVPSAQYVRISQLGVEHTFRLQDYFSGNTAIAPSWQGGDIVFFQSEKPQGENSVGSERPYVQILGQVRTPGEYPVLADGDLLTYLTKAGGPTDRADLANISLLRGNGTRREVQTLSLNDPKSLPQIQAGDTVIVLADNPSRVEKQSRIVSGFMSIFSFLANIALIVVGAS
jgi:protein involved in polysaccharide export with SLBB domain